MQSYNRILSVIKSRLFQSCAHELTFSAKIGTFISLMNPILIIIISIELQISYMKSIQRP
eukprot:UN00802